MNLQAMTKEKLQFMLPVVFTVGPDVNARGANSSTRHPHRASSPDHANAQEDRGDALMKYAMLLTDTKEKGSSSHTTQFLANIVKGIIEGEVRVLVSSMTMEEIFTEREEFSKSSPSSTPRSKVADRAFTHRIRPSLGNIRLTSQPRAPYLPQHPERA